ncbi:uncharacterized protein MONOS_18382 [Monocercomonoides exilis]|uniref:uncharacterized protein n=1 Tax=Monocercomonoides exilis TaxID=2049356 RepID=UPI0035599782|nr:hypothetical protein MONOS_18382 [Monocercomonoides exilis]
MVTMEMSPEEQWRRAEREAEKKNEERFKKRVYEKSLGHSESSEHLLSESGSTEYILGKDSDKIPEWVLEKDEEEKIRKQTPSPSISSTSTTGTSDTESTFVRGEDLCPTTSSMSNLVDAMACSSPHEKLIVDLRDSLFMLLHGKNEERDGDWHSAGEGADSCPNPVLGGCPHIVLFSEHMVICIAMHSECSSSDSDSSSISSSTIVTSSSDGSRRSKRYTRSPHLRQRLRMMKTTETSVCDGRHQNYKSTRRWGKKGFCFVFHWDDAVGVCDAPDPAAPPSPKPSTPAYPKIQMPAPALPSSSASSSSTFPVALPASQLPMPSIVTTPCTSTAPPINLPPIPQQPSPKIPLPPPDPSPSS